MAYGSQTPSSTSPQSSRKAKRQKRPDNAKTKQAWGGAPIVSSQKVADPFFPKNEKQRSYYDSLCQNTLTFGVGPAGVGKTFVGVSVAVKLLVEDRIEKIIITRPLQEAGEKLGALPGGLQEKTDPYMAPLLMSLTKHLGQQAVKNYIKEERIMVLPLAFMRGWTLDNCFAILDEAQNATKSQMKMFLTRIGENCRMVVDGDLSQSDIHGEGLTDAIQRMHADPDVGLIHFTHLDIVRSGIVQRVVENYARP